MSQNHHLPSRACASFAPLLPLATHDLLSASETARLRAHLATCAHCQAEIALYNRVEVAVRQTFAAPDAPPPFSREQIRRVLRNGADRPVSALPASSTETAGAPPVIPAPPVRRARLFPGGLTALSATIVIIVLVASIFDIPGLLLHRTGQPAVNLDRSKIDLTSISMVSASEGWAVGNASGKDEQGIILHYHNGRWWQVENPYDTGILHSIYMLSATDGWIVSYKGIILHYSRGRWVKVNSPVTSALGSVYMVSASEGWAIGYAILHYQNGVWTQVSAPQHAFIYSIDMLAPNEGWAVGAVGTILHYTGGQWQLVPGPHIDLTSVAMIASNVGWAVAFGNSTDENLLHYQDGQWSLVNSPAPGQMLWSIAMASPEEGWAVGATHGDIGLVLHYHAGQWSEIPPPTHDPLLGLALTSAAEGWAVGSRGAILHYLNGVWSNYTDVIPLEATSQTAPAGLDLSQYELHGISMISADEGWAVGNTRPYLDTHYGGFRQQALGGEPVILHYQHGRWTPQPLPDLKPSVTCDTNRTSCYSAVLGSISMVSAQEGWATGAIIPPAGVIDAPSYGVLLHYTGGKWVQVSILAGYLGSIYLRSANDGWMIGNALGPDGGGPPEVWHYDGHAWAPISDPLVSRFFPYHITGTASGGLWVSAIDFSVSPGDGFDGNAPSVLLHYDGTRWSKVDPHIANGELYSFAFVSPDEGWAVGTLPNTDQHKPSELDGLIMQYQNGVWQQQTLLQQPFGQTYFSLTGVAFVSSDEGWAVGDDGIIMHYANGTWTQAQSPTGESLSSLVLVSPGEGWAIGAQGTILHYHNGVWSLYR